jgi:HlyD family secretion protein
MEKGPTTGRDKAMKKWKKALLGLSGIVLIAATACSLPGQASDNGNAKVTRGDLEVSVTGTGSLTTRQEARLSFRTAGKIAEVTRSEGETVSSGEKLASLETDTLVLAKNQAAVDLAKAELGLSEAETGVTEARLAYATALNDLENARGTEETLNLAVVNARISLDQAQRTLSGTIAATDFYAVEASLNKARAWYDYANRMVSETTGDQLDTWLLALDSAKEKLDIAQTEYDNTLAGYDTGEIAIKKQQVEAAKLALASAEHTLAAHADTLTLQESKVATAQHAIDQAEREVAYATQTIDLARQYLEMAEKNLGGAVLTAPFEGVIAGVQVKTGDEVEAGAPVINLVKPNELELVVEIDEIDVARVKVGQDVLISVDAFPDQEFNGTVASVFPVPTKVTGLVMYNVKLSLTAPEGTGLKIGMRSSASIVVARKTGVILVPNQAVKDDGSGGHYVDVIAGKKVEQRPVTIGVHDALHTEVLSGLSEGETVAR